MVRNAVVNLARQRAAEALRAKGVNNDIIDRLPSIEDGFVNWISRSDMPMEAIDEMLEHAVDSLNRATCRTSSSEPPATPPAWVLDLLMTSMDADGDGLLSNTEVWTWANDRGLDVPPHLLATEEPEPAPEPEQEPVEEPQPAAREHQAPEPVEPTPEPEQVGSNPHKRSRCHDRRRRRGGSGLLGRAARRFLAKFARR